MITREDIFGAGEIDPTVLEWARDDLVGIKEIVNLLSSHPRWQVPVTKQYVFGLTKKPDFPSSILELAMGRLWSATLINEWADVHEPPHTEPLEGRPNIVTPELISEWRELATDGESFAEIGRRYHVHPTTISRSIRRED